MNCAIINIGDELLIGQVVNTNAAWMAKLLNDNNINVAKMEVVGDGFVEITDALTMALEWADAVILTGGLGPTKDDITRNVLVNYFHAHLVENPIVMGHIETYFRERGLTMTDDIREQALMPHNCELLFNRMGTAPGMWFVRDGKVVVSLPGVPIEMQYLMMDHVVPRLRARLTDEAIIHRTIMTQGLGESMIAHRIAEWEEALPSHFKLAYLPQAYQVRLRLSAKSNNKGVLEQEMEQQLARLLPMLEDITFATEDVSIEYQVAKELKRLGKSLSVAESCTGGALAQRMTAMPGASDYFLGGVVSYSNAMKQVLLGVSPDTLERCGAVSEETAVEMAVGMRARSGSDFALATTGIAGPAGGVEGKPVGTVWIALADDAGVIARCYHWKRDRAQNIERSVLQALFDLYNQLKNL